MFFRPKLKIGETFTNEDITNIFKCKNYGGMRRSLKTNSLVLISDHTKPFYGDCWLNGILHFAGIGLKGDQSLEHFPNSVLYESSRRRIILYLFEVFEKGKYIFTGNVTLEGDPYHRLRPDINGDLRKVWIFPLKPLKTAYKPKITQEMIKKSREIIERKISRLDDDKLEVMAKYSDGKMYETGVLEKGFEKNPFVREFVLRRAGERCELCGMKSPFEVKGRPYLEIYHIKKFRDGGRDVIENEVALCPNCIKKMQILNLPADKKKLIEKASIKLSIDMD